MRKIQILLLAALAAFLLAQAAYSLRWQIVHDEAPLLYEALLMQSGAMPYRDLFDFQMPGAYLAYYLLGALSNFGPFRLRLLDLAILAALLAITFLLMRRFGKIPAAASALLFGLMYLQGGAFMALQREYLFLPFVALAWQIQMRRDEPSAREHFLTGILFGLAAVIKPHAALGWLPLGALQLANQPKRARSFLLPTSLGFATPILAVLVWLGYTDSLAAFLDIVRNYWGLYAQINGNMEITTGGERLAFLVTQAVQLGGYGIWLLPAVLGVYLVPKENKKYAYALAGLAACYAIYPVFTGQFFDYHYLPLAYAISLLSSLALSHKPLSPANSRSSTSKLILHLSTFILVLAMLVNLRPSNTFLRQIQGKPLSKTTDRAYVIAKYLEENLQAGDTVQPLDWTGGTLLAMLQTRAPLATRYVFDFYFYHHVSKPYIQSLRADFMRQVESAPPDFIIEVIAEDKPWVSGKDTTRDFPKLREFLNANYSIEASKDDFIIYKSKR